VIGHALRIEDAVEVVAFMLHDAGMKPRRSRSNTVPSRPCRDSGCRDRAGRRRAAREPRGTLPTERELGPTGSMTGLISTVRSCSVARQFGQSARRPTRNTTMR